MLFLFEMPLVLFQHLRTSSAGEVNGFIKYCSEPGIQNDLTFLSQEQVKWFDNFVNLFMPVVLQKPGFLLLKTF